MPIFRRGATRAVLVVEPVAFKVARDERGARSNLYEAALYERTTPERRAMLCPLFWCSENGAILVAKALTPLTQSEMTHLMKTDGLPNWDYLPWDGDETPFEYKASDWGWLDGRPVALDYAAPALITKEELDEMIERSSRE